MSRLRPYRQRKILIDLLSTLSPVQWAAESLCTGWDTKDLVAHLIVRERNPFAAIGLVMPRFKGVHDRAMARMASRPIPELLTTLAAGPPLWAKVGQVHIGEDWIHTQDIIRGQAGSIDPDRELTPDSGNGHPTLVLALTKACDRFAPFVLRNVEGPFRVLLTDGQLWRRTWLVRPHNRLAIPAANASINPDVTVTGEVGEILLFLTGRGHHARVTVSGQPEAIRTLTTNLGGI